jgi:valyl-tRNA synthetase
VHSARWPAPDEIFAFVDEDARGVAAIDLATRVLGEIRRHKSEAKRPLRTAVTCAIVTGTPDELRALEDSRTDVCAAGLIERLVARVGEPFSVNVELAPSEALSKESGG